MESYKNNSIINSESIKKTSEPIHSDNRIKFTLGIGLITIGVIILLDMFLKTEWLILTSLPLVGMYVIILGIQNKIKYIYYPGLVLLCMGIGGMLVLLPKKLLLPINLLGIFFTFFGIGLILIFFTSIIIHDHIEWWVLIPAGIFIGLGIIYLFTLQKWTDFVMYPLCGLSIAMIIWGIGKSYIGLIIPGSIIISIGTGIFFAWGMRGELNSLSRIGMMLLIFSLGWILISGLGRLNFRKLIWWPLIPGGVLAVVGSGLYLGGNPGNAAVFIGNTGSIALIIFGFYLMLMRKGIQQ